MVNNKKILGITPLSYQGSEKLKMMFLKTTKQQINENKKLVLICLDF